MSSGKKKITQQDLRRLMNEHKNKKPKYINSPLAKYNDLGQLTCTLCKNIVVKEALWDSHKRSKQHLDSIAQLKREVEPTPPVDWKRPADVSTQPPPKKLKGILKNSQLYPIKTSEAVNTATSATTSATSSAASKVLSSEAVDEDPITTADDTNALPQKPPSLSNVLRQVAQNKKQDPNVAEIFFEPAKVSRSDSGDKKSTEDVLPEGFFDDPLLDAKARNIEYKNPVEEEWEKFQKEIKEETTVSAQIIAEDQDEATVERQIDEIDEQMRNWSRVLNMEVKKEQIAQELGKKIKNNVEDSSSGEDFDCEEYLDWRVKKAFD